MAETVLEDCCGQQCRTPSLPTFQPKAGPTSRPTRLLRTEKADCACARRADKLGAGAMAISGNIEAKWEKMGAVAGKGRRSKAQGPEALLSPPFHWLMFTTSVLWPADSRSRAPDRSRGGEEQRPTKISLAARRSCRTVRGDTVPVLAPRLHETALSCGVQ
ncbi:hypothetical protein MANI_001128 [Metarhizium anisopliae]|nr:hypothetical protein MANI_001128 [Metarhizium anisopliae]